MFPFAFGQRSRGHNALAHVSDGMNLPLSMTIHTVGMAGYGWSVIGVVEVEGAGGFPVVAGGCPVFRGQHFLGMRLLSLVWSERSLGIGIASLLCSRRRLIVEPT